MQHAHYFSLFRYVIIEAFKQTLKFMHAAHLLSLLSTPFECSRTVAYILGQKLEQKSKANCGKEKKQEASWRRNKINVSCIYTHHIKTLGNHSLGQTVLYTQQRCCVSQRGKQCVTERGFGMTLKWGISPPTVIVAMRRVQTEFMNRENCGK